LADARNTSAQGHTNPTAQSFDVLSNLRFVDVVEWANFELPEASPLCACSAKGNDNLAFPQYPVR
jgi:hypothetical protein